MTLAATRDASAAAEVPTRAGGGARPLALLLCLTACGYLVTVVANALSRSVSESSPMIFWVGVALVVVPITFRLSGAEASARERLLLVCLLGLGLYAIKLARDPLMFTYPDELVHSYNALAIDRGGGLYSANPILPATPYYPGLEGATAALMQASGMGVFTGGVVVVGIARLLMMVGLFVLFERTTGSPRAAGIGAAVYTANANFLYFDAQYSYESMALPLLAGVLAAVACWRRSPSRAWAVAIVLGTAAAVVTHHLSSLALAGSLIVLCVFQLASRGRPPGPNPWHFALAAAVMVLAWTTLVGDAVIDYLSPVFEGAVEGVKTTIVGDTPPRRLFKVDAIGESTTQAPIFERALSVIAVPLLFGLVVLGLVMLWRQRRPGVFQILLGLAAVAYFGTLALRFAPSAWEVGNRASGFLFVGVGFVVGCSRVERWRPRRAPRAGEVLLTAAVAIAVVGGIVAGWPASNRLSQPFVITAQGNRIESESLGLARWLSDTVPGQRFAAPAGDARWALVRGRATVFTGSHPDVKDMLFLPTMAPWMRKILRDNDIRYVITDRRFRGTMPTRAGHFTFRPPHGPPEFWIQQPAIEKFEAEGGVRAFDGGNIVVFDMGRQP